MQLMAELYIANPLNWIQDKYLPQTKYKTFVIISRPPHLMKLSSWFSGPTVRLQFNSVISKNVICKIYHIPDKKDPQL